MSNAEECEVERQRRYRSLGIDPLNPNPDGSDFHLMNIVDEELERDFPACRREQRQDPA